MLTIDDILRGCNTSLTMNDIFRGRNFLIYHNNVTDEELDKYNNEELPKSEPLLTMEIVLQVQTFFKVVECMTDDDIENVLGGNCKKLNNYHNAITFWTCLDHDEKERLYKYYNELVTETVFD